MSLIKRLWILVGVLVLVATLTAGFINIYSAEHYLENQIKIKNADTVTALAISISQQATDAKSVELLMSSQFDLGHYKRMDYLSPDGNLIARRTQKIPAPDVPRWFIALFPIEPEPGSAQVQIGWKLLGSLELESDVSFAYITLWQSFWTLAGWFLLGGGILGFLCMVYIRSQLEPLRRLVNQSEALANRHYDEVTPPRTLEFRLIVEAMNRSVQRTKQLLDVEAERLVKLKNESEVDKLTGFMVRSAFLRYVTAEIDSEDLSTHGLLLMVSIDNLQQLNESVGRTSADIAFADLAACIKRELSAESGISFGRLGSSELGVLLPNKVDSHSVVERLRTAVQATLYSSLLRLSFGVAFYSLGTTLPELLTECDQSLISARSSGKGSIALPVISATSSKISLDGWGAILRQALSAQELRLELYPLVSSAGNLILHQTFVRLDSSVSGKTHIAGEFLPWARRNGLEGKVDLEVVRLALESIKSVKRPLSVNLGYESICDDVQRMRLSELLAKNLQQAALITFDVPEEIAFPENSAFRDFCVLMHTLGCQIGLKNLNAHIGHLTSLHGTGLAYIKVGQALLQQADQDDAQRTLLRGLCTIIHLKGIQAYATGVNSTDAVATLFDLGFDAVAGQAVSKS